MAATPNFDKPAFPPPTGVTSDFNARDLGGAYIAALTCYMIILAFIVPARLYTRYFVIRLWGAEDYTVLLSWLFAIVFGGLSVPMYRAGFGRHIWNVRAQNVSDITYWLNVCRIQYDLAFMLVKISIVTQYRRIFTPKGKRSFMWWGTWGLTVVLVLFYTTAVFLNIFSCYPRKAIWDKTIKGRCFKQDIVPFMSAIFNAVTDFVILLMPQLSIWKLQLPLQKRIGLGIVFAVGIFAWIIACVRIYYTSRIFSDVDVFYLGMAHALLGGSELALGIVCACLPVIPRFFQSLARDTVVYTKVASAARRVLGRSGDSVKRGSSRISSAYGTRPSQEPPGHYKGTSLEYLHRAHSDGRSSKSVGSDTEQGIKKTVNVETTSDVHDRAQRTGMRYDEW